jgi:hypothetical protein
MEGGAGRERRGGRGGREGREGREGTVGVGGVVGIFQVVLFLMTAVEVGIAALPLSSISSRAQIFALWFVTSW